MVGGAKVPFSNLTSKESMSDAEVDWYDKVKKVKEYVLQYFIPCKKPVCYLHWEPLTQSIEMYNKQELPQILKPQACTLKETDEKGKVFIKESFELYSWFITNVLDLAQLVMDMNK